MYVQIVHVFTLCVYIYISHNSQTLVSLLFLHSLSLSLLLVVFGEPPQCLLSPAVLLWTCSTVPTPWTVAVRLIQLAIFQFWRHPMNTHFPSTNFKLQTPICRIEKTIWTNTPNLNHIHLSIEISQVPQVCCLFLLQVSPTSVDSTSIPLAMRLKAPGVVGEGWSASTWKTSPNFHMDWTGPCRLFLIQGIYTTAKKKQQEPLKQYDGKGKRSRIPFWVGKRPICRKNNGEVKLFNRGFLCSLFFMTGTCGKGDGGLPIWVLLELFLSCPLHSPGFLPCRAKKKYSKQISPGVWWLFVAT